jgi:hypothetical protein
MRHRLDKTAMIATIVVAWPMAVLAVDDTWSGTYSLTPIVAPVNQTETIGSQLSKESWQVTIERIADEDVSRLSSKYEGLDPKRWVMKMESEKGSVKLRRFLADQYKDLQITLYDKRQTIECVDGGRLFMCKSMPGVPVSVGKGQSLETISVKSGIWGVRLHAGAFELIPVEKK